ncbi:MAG: hypothetical protein M3R61_00735 [Chloroflexota bacterium]|nr:hypothetical protein [Chloroflexota bacterium]
MRHAPERFAVMLAPAEAQRLGQKYMERRGVITDTMIARHLNGAIALAVPAAVDGRAHLLPLDIDAGGIDAIHALIAEAARRELWAFGQYCRRDGLAEIDQRGYVWLPFDTLSDAHRLQALGAQLIAASSHQGWRIETRAFHAATRLPLARHTHTRRFGDLVLADRQIVIDQDPAGALAKLHDAYRENSSTGLPELVPLRSHAPSQPLSGMAQESPSPVTIRPTTSPICCAAMAPGQADGAGCIFARFIRTITPASASTRSVATSIAAVSARTAAVRLPRIAGMTPSTSTVLAKVSLRKRHCRASTPNHGRRHYTFSPAQRAMDSIGT